jgi:hypothetical protein
MIYSNDKAYPKVVCCDLAIQEYAFDTEKINPVADGLS